MQGKDGFKVSTRDMVLRGWQNSTELVRDFQNYARQIDGDDEIADMFAGFAEDEAMHASQLLKYLRNYERD